MVVVRPSPSSRRTPTLGSRLPGVLVARLLGGCLVFREAVSKTSIFVVQAGYLELRWNRQSDRCARFVRPRGGTTDLTHRLARARMVTDLTVGLGWLDCENRKRVWVDAMRSNLSVSWDIVGGDMEVNESPILRSWLNLLLNQNYMSSSEGIIQIRGDVQCTHAA